MKREAMHLEENKEGYMESLDGGKGNWTWCNYITSQLKKK